MDTALPTAEEEMEIAECLPEIGNEQAFVYFVESECCWQYSLTQPVGKIDVDFEVFSDVDAAYNVVQKRNDRLSGWISHFKKIV
jgi:hypothetical protein